MTTEQLTTKALHKLNSLNNIIKQLYDSVLTDKQYYLDIEVNSIYQNLEIEVNSIYQNLETLRNSIAQTANTSSAIVNQSISYVLRFYIDRCLENYKY